MESDPTPVEEPKAFKPYTPGTHVVVFCDEGFVIDETVPPKLMTARVESSECMAKPGVVPGREDYIYVIRYRSYPVLWGPPFRVTGAEVLDQWRAWHETSHGLAMLYGVARALRKYRAAQNAEMLCAMRACGHSP